MYLVLRYEVDLVVISSLIAVRTHYLQRSLYIRWRCYSYWARL